MHRRSAHRRVERSELETGDLERLYWSTLCALGELAYNADRVLALEEQGHKFYGLWMHDPYWYNTVGTLAAGLPMIQPENEGCIVAAQTLARKLGTGVFYRSIEDLAAKLKDGEAMRGVRERGWEQRHLFTFDHHVPALVAFFREVIGSGSRKSIRGGSVVQSS